MELNCSGAPAYDPPPTLEELFTVHTSDKSHAEHKYTDLYSMLFEAKRTTTRNVTEIGIYRARSVRVWAEYFPRAHVWGIDLPSGQRGMAKRYVENCSRVTLRYGDSRNPAVPAGFGFAKESMDIIIDDGDHLQPSNARTLEAWWPYLRPGGIYCVEDVSTGANHKNRYGGGDMAPAGHAPLVHDERLWSTAVQRIFAEHDSFFADTLIGHNSYGRYARVKGHLMHKDRVSHLSHVLVLRKRLVPRRVSG